MRLNRLTSWVRDICREQVPAEKWLLAPSLRVGHQWLDTVARSGTPVVNVRVKTRRSLALELAAAEMSRQGLRYLQGVRREILMDGVFAGLRRSRGAYLSGLKPSAGLTRALCSSVEDLRLAGLAASDLRPADFEVEPKGRDMAKVLRTYEKTLEESRLADYAAALRMAADRLRADPSLVAEDMMVLMPRDLEADLRRLERGLWEAIPAGRRRVLETDRAEGAGRAEGPAAGPGAADRARPEGGIHPDSAGGAGDGREGSDLSLLGHLASPMDAPAPRNDGTARIFRAVGEVNEIREVLRRCLEEGIPLDDVEILYTDSHTYLPLIYEIASAALPEGDGALRLPVTFYEGIPPRYSRPARALLGWLQWVSEDLAQSTLVRMVQDGLLATDAEGDEGEGMSFSRLGAILRSVPIGGGRDRYAEAIDREVAALEAAAADPASRSLKGGADENGENGDDGGSGRGREPGRRAEGIRRRIRALKSLRRMVSGLLAITPEGGGATQRDLLGAASSLLRNHARCVGEFDQYARKEMLEDIGQLAECVEQADAAGLDVLEWLSDLCRSSHVGGLGPRPGCLYAAPLAAGGHSGRWHTFIVGLDDGRFPGTGIQDPLLLDRERARLSPDIPTASGRLARSTGDFAALLCRLRGTVTLSYPCRSLTDDRELFPSPVLLAAYRILSGNREGDPNDLVKWTTRPASFAPASPARSIDANEWWLSRTLSGEGPVAEPDSLLGAHFPHLARGLAADRARASDRFTEYDGFVPEAGPDLDPTRPEGVILSATALEKLGACPLEYFFRYVLGVSPPEEYRIDPGVWLEPMQKGELLHEAFREFMGRVCGRGRLPAYPRDWDLMSEILEAGIEAWKRACPPPNPDTFERGARELRQAARIFLQEEEILCRGSQPLYLEAALGLAPGSAGTGSPLDTPWPVAIELARGERVRARGRIDRVDRVTDMPGQSYAVWDYKTGSGWKYRRRKKRKWMAEGGEPFDQGRVIQNVLYRELVEARLKEAVSPDARVVRFGYFFPSLREHGERVAWTAGELAAGREVLSHLCAMLAGGCFPFTDDKGDVELSDYRAAFGDIEQAAERAKRKMKNLKNAALDPIRALRGSGEGDEEED
jgi:hypothetical protein